MTEISYRQLVHAARRELRRDPLHSAASLAKKISCSERTLNRAFAAAGCVMREEREHMRLDRAARILLAKMPIAEAARHSGYASSCHLAEPFRRRFGVNPSRMCEIGEAVQSTTWQSKQPGPYRGTFQQRQRNAAWRAKRRVLRQARGELTADTMPLREVERALGLRLPRPREPRAPLTLYEVFAADASWPDLPPRLKWNLRRAA